jgi:hypothetical protein
VRIISNVLHRPHDQRGITVTRSLAKYFGTLIKKSEYPDLDMDGKTIDTHTTGLVPGGLVAGEAPNAAGSIETRARHFPLIRQSLRNRHEQWLPFPRE